ncbi:MarR family winged helix-turn-helix transcriptional regulator [Kineococcus sp. SYSU DK001]|uniref:MarR family winged helix-turn-helix transcriptional regulator n=1 Tax=Kineococcus sp. SYSU DK001 TaxID=3383122 RepID=UPI003D7E2C0F
MVLEAVCSAAPSPASVRDVADQLGLDHSGASRLVTDAVSRDLLSSTPSPQDARVRHLLLTPRGEQLIDDAHRWQEEVFRELTAGWSRRDVENFHLLMSRLINAAR